MAQSLKQQLRALYEQTLDEAELDGGFDAGLTSLSHSSMVVAGKGGNVYLEAWIDWKSQAIKTNTTRYPWQETS